mmetsp:Transcript_103607/g.259827  ORF Transcript_103607/g.259827 Transcript_103607/m.259827 type:complete len:322 (-) Transcript_103607:533-1498(-)
MSCHIFPSATCAAWDCSCNSEATWLSVIDSKPRIEHRLKITPAPHRAFSCKPQALRASRMKVTIARPSEHAGRVARPIVRSMYAVRASWVDTHLAPAPLGGVAAALIRATSACERKTRGLERSPVMPAKKSGSEAAPNVDSDVLMAVVSRLLPRGRPNNSVAISSKRFFSGSKLCKAGRRAAPCRDDALASPRAWRDHSSRNAHAEEPSSTPCVRHRQRTADPSRKHVSLTVITGSKPATTRPGRRKSARCRRSGSGICWGALGSGLRATVKGTPSSVSATARPPSTSLPASSPPCSASAAASDSRKRSGSAFCKRSAIAG